MNHQIPANEKVEFFLEQRIPSDKAYAILMGERASSDFFKQTAEENVAAKRRYRFIKYTDYLMKIAFVFGLAYYLFDMVFRGSILFCNQKK